MTEDRFVFVPLRFRREHREWSNAEHAAWVDLLLASLEVEGRFDSLEVARAYLGPRAAALDALIARGAFAEFEGAWSLSDYHELYDGRRPRHYKTLAQRLADADAREARGEPLLPIERWARWRQRQKAKAAGSVTETEGEGEGDKDKERDSANVGPTLANDPTPMLPRLGNLYEAFTQLTGLPCEAADRSRIDNLCRTFDRDLVRRAMYADPEPSRNPAKFLGRVYHRLKEGAAA